MSEIKLPKENFSKIEIMKSSSFPLDSSIECIFYDNIQFDMHSKHENPIDYAMKRLGLIESCIELIVPNEDPKNNIVSQIKELDPSISWSGLKEARSTICSFIKTRWKEIEGIEPEHYVYDRLISKFELSITLLTTLNQFNHLKDDAIEIWDYTVYTPFGEFEI